MGEVIVVTISRGVLYISQCINCVALIAWVLFIVSCSPSKTPSEHLREQLPKRFHGTVLEQSICEGSLYGSAEGSYPLDDSLGRGSISVRNDSVIVALTYGHSTPEKVDITVRFPLDSVSADNVSWVGLHHWEHNGVIASTQLNVYVDADREWVHLDYQEEYRDTTITDLHEQPNMRFWWENIVPD